MSSSILPASRHQPASPASFPAIVGISSRPATSARTRHLQPLAAASIAALILSGCGGGGEGSGYSADVVQAETTSADTSMAKFESFVSANPQVRSTIQATPYGTKDDDLSGEDAERAAAAEDDAGDSKASSEDEADKADDADGEGSSASVSGSIADTLISDMSEMNDMPLKDVNPVYGFARGPGYNLAGTNAGGANFVLPWFVQFEGVENGAWNTRVQMRNLRLFVKSRSTGEWSRLIDSDSFSGIQCDQGSNYFHCPQQAKVSDDGDSSSTLPLPNLNLHGWWGGREPVKSWDMAAMVISVEARLIKNGDNGVDDRSKAKYLLQVGADYYPTDASHNRILEAVGVSRGKLVTNDWQAFTFTTLGDVGKQEPGGGISSSELRKNPPPLY
jgi:hypothetical protein